MHEKHDFTISKNNSRGPILVQPSSVFFFRKDKCAYESHYYCAKGNKNCNLMKTLNYLYLLSSDVYK